jgi:hypothetical protein
LSACLAISCSLSNTTCICHEQLNVHNAIEQIEDGPAFGTASSYPAATSGWGQLCPEHDAAGSLEYGSIMRRDLRSRLSQADFDQCIGP